MGKDNQLLTIEGIIKDLKCGVTCHGSRTPSLDEMGKELVIIPGEANITKTLLGRLEEEKIPYKVSTAYLGGENLYYLDLEKMNFST